jgi:hypothetical protein
MGQSVRSGVLDVLSRFQNFVCPNAWIRHFRFQAPLSKTGNKYPNRFIPLSDLLIDFNRSLDIGLCFLNDNFDVRVPGFSNMGVGNNPLSQARNFSQNQPSVAGCEQTFWSAKLPFSRPTPPESHSTTFGRFQISS